MPPFPEVDPPPDDQRQESSRSDAPVQHPSCSKSLPDGEAANDDAFERILGDLEISFQSLKERYQQIKQDQSQQAALQQRLGAIELELQTAQSQPQITELKKEAQQILRQLEALSVNLESRLINWESLREVFWQAVRFVGLGIVVGWVLRSCVG
ncbi:hypothetical protein [Trichothermofontia sp.]